MFHRDWLRSLPLRLVGAFRKCPAPRRRRTPEFSWRIEHLENLVLLGDTVPMLVASILGDSPVTTQDVKSGVGTEWLTGLATPIDRTAGRSPSASAFTSGRRWISEDLAATERVLAATIQAQVSGGASASETSRLGASSGMISAASTTSSSDLGPQFGLEFGRSVLGIPLNTQDSIESPAAPRNRVSAARAESPADDKQPSQIGTGGGASSGSDPSGGVLDTSSAQIPWGETLNDGGAQGSVAVSPSGRATPAAPSGPETRPDAYTTYIGTSLTVDGDGVLTNDSGNGHLRAVNWTAPGNGTLTSQANGRFTYTPDADYRGIDGFTYQVSDGRQLSDPVSVSILVDGQAPVTPAPQPTDPVPAKPPSVGIEKHAAYANEDDADSETFVVYRNGLPYGDLTVHLSVAGVDPTDATVRARTSLLTVTIPDGQTAVPVRIPTKFVDVDGVQASGMQVDIVPNEHFELRGRKSVDFKRKSQLQYGGAAQGQRTAAATGSASPRLAKVLSFSLGDATVVEGASFVSIPYTITGMGALAETIEFSLGTTGSSFLPANRFGPPAGSGSSPPPAGSYPTPSNSLDIVPVSLQKQLNCPSNQQCNGTLNVGVNVLNDSRPESTEMFVVTATNFSTVSGSVINVTKPQSSVSIVDNTPCAPTVNVSGTSITERESTAESRFRVYLSCVATTEVSVSFSTSQGSATPGSDYATVITTVTIPGGQIDRYVNVPILGDLVVENMETFNVMITPLSGATPGITQATGTIYDNDVLTPQTPALPTLSPTVASTFDRNPPPPCVCDPVMKSSDPVTKSAPPLTVDQDSGALTVVPVTQLMPNLDGASELASKYQAVAAKFFPTYNSLTNSHPIVSVTATIPNDLTIDRLVTSVLVPNQPPSSGTIGTGSFTVTPDQIGKEVQFSVMINDYLDNVSSGIYTFTSNTTAYSGSNARASSEMLVTIPAINRKYSKFGNRWFLPGLDVLFTPTSNDSTALVRGDGSSVRFSKSLDTNGFPTYLAPPGILSSLKFNTTSQELELREAGVTKIFKTSTNSLVGRLERIVDNGQTFILKYNGPPDGLVGSGALTAVNALLGNGVTEQAIATLKYYGWNYDGTGNPGPLGPPHAEGQLASIQAYGQPTYTFQYSALNYGTPYPSTYPVLSLISEVNQDGGESPRIGFNYDAAQQGLMTDYFGPESQYTTIAYEAGNLRTHSFSHLGGSNLAPVTETFTARQLKGLAMSPTGNALVTTNGGASAELTDQAGTHWRKMLDKFGNVLESSYDASTTPGTEQWVVTATYDRDQDGGLNAAETWDGHGALMRTRYPDGSSVQYAYDTQGRGRVTSERSFSPDGKMTGVKGWEYDPASNDARPRKVIDANNRYIEYRYNTTGDVDKVTDRMGAFTSYEYTNTQYPHLVTAVVEPDPDLDPATGTNGTLTSPRTEYNYDSAGRLTKVKYKDQVSPGADKERNFDDPATTDATGNPSTAADFDAFGHPKYERDEDGYVTRRAYDTFGRIKTLTLPDPDLDPATGTNGPLTTPIYTYTYDDLGRLKTVADPAGKTTTYTYNIRGWLENIHESGMYNDPENPGITAPVVRETFTYYNPDGTVDREVDPLNRTTSYDYDKLGRVKEITYPDPDGAGPEAPVKKFEYDSLGRIYRERDQFDFGIEYEYWSEIYTTTGEVLSYVDQFRIDASGTRLSRVQKQYFDVEGLLRLELEQVQFNISNPTNFWTFHYYDSEDREVTTVSPDGSSSDRVYDFAGRLNKSRDAGVSEWTTYDYNMRGWLTAETVPVIVGASTNLKYEQTTYAYDGRGNLTKVTLPDPDGILNDPTNPTLAATDGSQTAPVVNMDYDGLSRVTRRYIGLSGAPVDDRSMTYDASGFLSRETVQVSATDSYFTEYKSDSFGRQRWERTQMPGPAGTIPHTTRWFYFNNDLLYIVNVFANDANGVQTEYAVDDLNRTTSIKNPLNGIKTLAYTVLPTGNHLVTETNEHLVTEIAEQFYQSQTESDPWGRVVIETDQENRTTVTTYDNRSVPLTVQDKLGNLLYYEFDGLGRVTRVGDSQQDQAGKFREALAYAPNGEVRSQVDTQGRTTLRQFAASTGQMQSEQFLPTGATTLFEYDYLGRTYRVIHPAGNGTTSAVTQTKFDALDRPLEVRQDAENINAVQKYEYDRAGRISASVDPENRRTEFKYDPLGRSTEVARIDAVTGQIDRTKTFYDDGFGIRHTDLLGIPTSQRRVEQDVTPNGATLQTLYQSDKLGRIVRQADVLERATVYGYDAASNLTSLKDPVGNTTTFAYTARNQLQSETNAYNATRLYQYDNMGHLQTKIDRNANRIDYAWTFAYNGQENYRPNTETWSTVASPQLPDSPTAANTIHHTYNGNGQLETVYDKNATHTFLYDAAGRVTVDIDAYTGLTNQPTVAFNHSYDLLDRRTTLVTTYLDRPWNQAGGVWGVDVQRNFSYDRLNRMTQITQQQPAYNPLTPNFSQAPETPVKVSLTYKKDGQFDTIKRYANYSDANPLVQTTHQYDGQGRLQELKHTRFPATANTVLADYDFTYDRADRLLTMSHSTQVDPSVEAAVSEGTSTYTYEATNTNQSVPVLDGTIPLSDQLVRAAHGNGHGTETFGYDANGNRNTIGFTPTTDNRYASDGTYNYVYDNEGNLQNRWSPNGLGAEVFTWDHRQRLTSVTYYNGPGTIIKKVEFRYDALDRRIEKRVDDGFGGAVDGVFERNERYWSDGRDLLYVTDGNFVPNVSFGQMQTRYLPGPAVDQVFADETIVGELLWALSDHQGTPRDFARNDAPGTITNHVWYTAFGQPANERVATGYYSGSFAYWSLTNPASWRHLRTGFTSFEYDPDTKGAFSWTRVYFADMGRWLNPDPIGFLGDTSNPYRFNRNSPANYIDPSGLSDMPWWEGTKAGLKSFYWSGPIQVAKAAVVGVGTAARETAYYVRDVNALAYDALFTAAGHPLGVEEWSQIGQSNQPSDAHFWSNSFFNAGRAGAAGLTAGGSEVAVGTYDFSQTGDADALRNHLGGVAGNNLTLAAVAKAGPAMGRTTPQPTPTAPPAGVTVNKAGQIIVDRPPSGPSTGTPPTSTGRPSPATFSQDTNCPAPSNAQGAESTANLSKGTTLPRVLREQLAVEEALSRPTAGTQLPLKMTDPRWPASDGWVKMQQVIQSGGREGPINVHYLRNTITGATADPKIVLPGVR